MFKVSFISIHPEFIRAYFEFGVFAAAKAKGLATIDAINLRDFAIDSRGTIDDTPYGGGDSMVMRPEPLKKALDHLGGGYVIMPSPGGKPWNQKQAQALLDEQRPIIVVCGRFAGIDQRFCDLYVDAEFSLGDFVISGGELAGLTMIDSCLRLIPESLGNAESARYDSFSPQIEGLLEHPLYTRPPLFEGIEVPEVLRSGHHEHIQKWRRQQSIERTSLKRPDLVKSSNPLTKGDKES
jgi:tRNA (guanine37-N1)-methyltransferase